MRVNGEFEEYESEDGGDGETTAIDDNDGTSEDEEGM